MSVHSASGGGDPLMLMQWKRHQSAHFVFRFLPGSTVEKSVTLVADRLEAIRAATIGDLGLTDLPSERVQVYLSDLPDDGRQIVGDGQLWRVGGQQVIAAYL